MQCTPLAALSTIASVTQATRSVMPIQAKPNAPSRTRKHSWPALLALLLLLTESTLCAAAPTDAPAQPQVPAAPQALPTDDNLQLDDAAEPLVPLKARGGGEEDHIQALALFAAAR